MDTSKQGEIPFPCVTMLTASYSDSYAETKNRTKVFQIM